MQRNDFHIEALNRSETASFEIGKVRFASRRLLQLLRIEQLPGENAVYAGTSALPKGR